MKIGYRADIDGLRAIAVSLVVFFHAGFPLVDGGYIGVDVFFVISGYIITRILIAQQGMSFKTVLDFYVRRFRRIFPALFVVVMASSLMAWYVYMPSEKNDFGKSIFSVAGFFSNFYFWKSLDYFSSGAHDKFLVHTWSLSVEEQFYIFYPALIFVFRKSLFALFVLLIFISLVAATVFISIDRFAVFYLLPFRAWELLLGGLIVIKEKEICAYFSQLPKWLHDLISVVSIFLIFFSAFFYDNESGVPGVSGLVPVLGAVLVIVVGYRENIVTKILSNPFLVGVGVCSYSAYLWHQPIFAVAGILFPNGGVGWAFLVLVVFPFVSYFSYVFVERPFRNPGFVFYPPRSVIVFFVSGLFVFVLVGFLFYAGIYQKDHPASLIFSARSELGAGEKFCHERSKFREDGLCVIGDLSAKPTGVLIGDSYAGTLILKLNEKLESRNVAYYALVDAGCVPIIGLYHIGSGKCDLGLNEEKFKFAMDRTSVVDVLIYGAFSKVLNGDTRGIGFSPGYYGSSYSESILNTIKKLVDYKKRVVFIGQQPVFSPDPLLYNFRSGLINGDFSFRASYTAKADVVRSNDQLNLISNYFDSSVRFVWPQNLFCDEIYCYYHDSQGRYLYSDSSHLNQLGAEFLINNIFF